MNSIIVESADACFVFRISETYFYRKKRAYLWEGSIEKLNLFDFFFDLTHRKKEEEWVETVGTFNGNVQKAVDYERYGTKRVDYNTYELEYYAGDKKRKGWYTFHPLPEPDPEALKGTTIRMRYMKKRPFIIEEITDEQDEE